MKNARTYLTSVAAGKREVKREGNGVHMKSNLTTVIIIDK
jgi:hypothetical protein